MFALELDEAVIAAFFAVREFAANRRASFIDRAATQLGIQELAGGFINVVGAMPQNALFNVIVRVAFGKFIGTRKGDFGALMAETKMFGQSVDIALGHDDSRVAAAIAGALAAIVVYFCLGHTRIL